MTQITNRGGKRVYQQRRKEGLFLDKAFFQFLNGQFTTTTRYGIKKRWTRDFMGLENPNKHVKALKGFHYYTTSWQQILTPPNKDKDI